MRCGVGAAPVALASVEALAVPVTVPAPVAVGLVTCVGGGRRPWPWLPASPAVWMWACPSL